MNIKQETFLELIKDALPTKKHLISKKISNKKWMELKQPCIWVSEIPIKDDLGNVLTRWADTGHGYSAFTIEYPNSATVIAIGKGSLIFNNMYLLYLESFENAKFYRII